ncbi:MAG TPA: response regulator [Gemmatimonadaceae bacterium]|nr:response regulator [Gemmatimonadaceae bacterium]
MSHILCAAADSSARMAVVTALDLAGHATATAPDGPSALAAIEAREPDLLVLAEQLAGMDGLAVCRAVKLNPFTARIPVLMLMSHLGIEHTEAAFEAGADDSMLMPFDPRELRVRVVALLRLVRREGDRNPTSGLPGGKAIEEEIARRVAQREPFALCYLDLDHFKPFADTFGFTAADAVIRELGSAIRAAVEARGAPGDFVGHIGGDDFLAVTGDAAAESIAKECAARFVEVAARAVGEEAVRRGTFTGIDRDGVAREFPIARLSAAVLRVDPAKWMSTGHIGSLAADVKRRAKQRGPGTILVQAV